MYVSYINKYIYLQMLLYIYIYMYVSREVVQAFEVGILSVYDRGHKQAYTTYEPVFVYTV